MLISAGLLVLAIGAGQGFEFAGDVQDAKPVVIAALFGAILAVPLIFILIALARNNYRYPQRDSRANPMVSVLAFGFLLCAVAGGLKLYASFFFANDDQISGSARTAFVEKMQKSCFHNQRSLAGNEKVADAQITKFCDCVGERLADKTSYKELRIEMLDPKAIDGLKQRAVLTGRECLKSPPPLKEDDGQSTAQRTD